MNNFKNIAVCLPVYNESDNVEYLISSIKKVFDGFLFVVDGFSNDNSILIAKQLNIPVYYRKLPGKGSAIQLALEIAEKKNKEFLIYFDCDRTYEPLDIVKIIEFTSNHDLILGVRKLNTIPFTRRIGNIISTELINLRFNGKIKDSLTGFRCLRVEKFRPLIHENSFFVEPIICITALKHKMAIKTVSINHYTRSGESKMSLPIGLWLLLRLLWLLAFH